MANKTDRWSGSWFVQPTNSQQPLHKAKNFVPATSPNKKYNPKKYKQEYKKQYGIKTMFA